MAISYACNNVIYSSLLWDYGRGRGKEMALSFETKLIKNKILIILNRALYLNKNIYFKCLLLKVKRT